MGAGSYTADLARLSVEIPLPRPARAERERLLSRLRLPAEQAAPALLGQVLIARQGGHLLRARIVETEAYLPRRDPGAHVFRGRTPRVAPLFGPPGSIYVYFVYGMHHCLNLAVDEEGTPGCVLIRAAEITGDARAAGSASTTRFDPALGRGPALLCRTLGLTVKDSGSNLFAGTGSLTLREGDPPRWVIRSRRIGLSPSAGARRVLRFFDATSAAVSGPNRRGRGAVV
jgi:DNA-3-methyladenine glycosylase